jgi:hypothetical protein
MQTFRHKATSDGRKHNKVREMRSYPSCASNQEPPAASKCNPVDEATLSRESNPLEDDLAKEPDRREAANRGEQLDYNKEKALTIGIDAS